MTRWTVVLSVLVIAAGVGVAPAAVVRRRPVYSD